MMLFLALRRLKSEKWNTRRKAVRELANSTSEKATDALVWSLNDSERCVRELAAEALKSRQWTRTPSNRALLAVKLGNLKDAAAEGDAAVPLLIAEYFKRRERSGAWEVVLVS
jgi:HEAT repeat protein